MNVMDKLPKKLQPQAKQRLQDVAYAQSRPEAEDTLVRDRERMVTFYQFPKEHWKHLRTTNVVESPFAALRLRADAAKRYKKVENATVVIWKMLMLSEQRFRRLNAPEKLTQVYWGTGMRAELPEVQIEREKVLAFA